MLGTMAVIDDEVLTANVAEVAPSMTLVATVKFEPVIVTCWPA
jgi:hypothetical protein